MQSCGDWDLIPEIMPGHPDLSQQGEFTPPLLMLQLQVFRNFSVPVQLPHPKLPVEQLHVQDHRRQPSQDIKGPGNI